MSWLPLRHLESRGLHALFATAMIFTLGVVCILLVRPAALGILVRSPVLWLLALVAGINNACFNWAMTTGDVVRAILLFYLMPVWAVLLARWLLKEPLTIATRVRIGIALVGAFIVLWQPGTALPLPSSLADWLAIIAGAAFALNNVLLRKHADVPGEARALAMFLGAAVFAASLAAGLAFTQPQLGVAWPDFSTQSGVPDTSWLGSLSAAFSFAPPWLIPLTLFAILMLSSNLTLQYGASRLAAGLTAMVMLSEILFATGSAVLIGDEVLSLRAVLGGVLIIGATVHAAIGAARQ
jgi:drug/metabolite transporter (DMT)-like permease